MSSGVRTEGGNEVRIRQKSYIEEQVGVIGYTRLVAKADHRNHDVFVRAAGGEPGGDVRTQLMDVEFGAVHHDIRQGADGLQQTALLLERLLYRGIFSQRVGTASLTEAAQQRFIRGFKVKHRGIDLLAQRLNDPGQALELFAFADVGHQSGLFGFRGLFSQVSEAWYQVDGQVIN